MDQDQAAMDSVRQVDQNGYVTIEMNPISRAGVFPYLGRTIGAENPDEVYYVYRPAEELADPECQESFKLIPIIDDHTMLGPEEQGLTPAEKKGTHGVVGERVAFKENVLYANLKLFSETLKSLILSGKRDLSLAYRCRYEKLAGIFEGQSYQFVQRALRGNHLALVDRARCDVRVLDSHITFDHFDLNLKGMDMDENKEAQGAAASQGGTSLQAVIARIDQLSAAVEKLIGMERAEAAQTTAADADKSAEDLKKAEADKGAMDAAIGKLTSELEAMKKEGMKAFISEVSQRDALAEKLSHHIGTFDSKDMTLSEVCVYGAEKLGLKVEKGAERFALDGFLHNRPVPTAQKTVGMDSATKQDGAIQKYLEGKE